MNEQQIPTSEVLNRAADLIEERGWIGRDRPPLYDTWGWYDNVTGPICAEGAIGAAAFGDNRGWASIDLNDRCPAGIAVLDYLNRGNRAAIWQWNDAPGRTAAEVIEVLRAVAVIEAAREEQAAKVEVSA